MFARRNQHKLSLGSRGYGYAITLLSLRDISPKRGIFADPYNLQINIFFANFADGQRNTPSGTHFVCTSSLCEGAERGLLIIASLRAYQIYFALREILRLCLRMTGFFD